jgi:hypothetical protein
MAQLYAYQSAGTDVPQGWIKQPFYTKGFYNRDRSRGDERLVKQLALAHDHRAPLIWDIEHWRLPRDMDKFIEIIQWARDVRPDLRQSYYIMLPERNYWAPVEYHFRPNNITLKKLNDWKERNAALMPLAEVVDFISPSLYTFYRNDDGHFALQDTWWFAYAEANIAEAKKYNKQVVPWLSPRLWRSAGQELMDLAFFRRQIEFVLQAADGVMVFDWIDNEPRIDLDQVVRGFAI